VAVSISSAQPLFKMVSMCLEEPGCTWNEVCFDSSTLGTAKTELWHATKKKLLEDAGQDQNKVANGLFM
jgi:hypothetical protein